MKKKNPKNGEILWKKIVNNSSLAIKEERYLCWWTRKREAKTQIISYLFITCLVSPVYIHIHPTFYIAIF